MASNASILANTIPNSVVQRLLVSSLVHANNEAWEIKQKDAI